MLRITAIESTANTVTLRLEGQIVGAWTDELATACERVLGEKSTLTLDLGDVTLIDRSGFSLLAALARRGVSFSRCSPFQEEQLRFASSLLQVAIARPNS